jgi:preprotein translocase subunit SecE
MAWQLLFGSDMGLMSLFVIVFVIVMAAFLYNFAKKHMAEDAKQAK